MTKTQILTKTGRKISKYIAFNPSSSESKEWWTANSLKEMKDILWASSVAIATIKKFCDGMYGTEDIEIYDVKKHPEAIEGLE